MNPLKGLLFGRRRPGGGDSAPSEQAVPTQAVHGRTGYSAYGEDLLMLGWLNHYSVPPERIRYLDIGAAMPAHLNNTYLFYSIGARGLLVEPDPDQAAILREARPRDVVMQVGVAFDERRSAKLHRFTNRVFNTFSEEQAEFVLETSRTWPENVRQSLVDRVEIELVPINEMISRHMPDHAPHLVSIDVEGVELPVIRSLDLALLKFDEAAPSFICAEAQGYPRDWLAVVEPHSYVVSARTPDNLIFRRDPTWVTPENLAGIRA